MKINFSKYLQGGSIIASSYLPITVTPGAYGPSVKEIEQTISTAITPNKTKKDDTKSLTEKDLIESLKGIEGLPTDVNFVISKIKKDLSLAEILKDPVTGSSPISISDAYLKGIQYINLVKISKLVFDKAYQEATSKNSINEAAITSLGLLVVKTKEKQLTTIGVGEYLNHRDKYLIQTNGDLLQSRRSDPNFTFTDGVLDIVSNGVSTKTITEFINMFTSKLGKDTLQQQGYSEIQSNRVINGIKIIQDAASNGVDLTGGIDGIYNSTKITEDLKRQVNEAITALYKMMPDNYKTLLALKSGNRKDPIKGILDILTLMVDKNSDSRLIYSVQRYEDKDDKEKKNGSKKGSSEGSDDFDKQKQPAVAEWFRGGGEQKTFVISLDGSQGFVVKGNNMGITSGDRNIGVSTLEDVTKSDFGGALDVNNATFGNGMRIDINGTNKIIILGDSLTGVELPLDPTDDTPKPYLKLLPIKEKADAILKGQGIDPDKDPNELTLEEKLAINQVYLKNSLPQKYDSFGKVILNKWMRFGLVKATTTQEAILGDVDPRYIRTIESDNEIANYQQLRRKFTGESDYKFENAIFFGGDHLYQGTLFIPVTNSYIKATSGAGTSNVRSLNQSLKTQELEEARKFAIENLDTPPKPINKQQLQ